MKKSPSALVTLFLFGCGSTSLLLAQQPALPPGVKVQPSIPALPGVKVQPSFPALPPGVKVQPSIPATPFPNVQPMVQQPAVPAAPTATQDRIQFHLTNGGSQDLTIYLKYINTDGNIRVLKADRVQTVASGEKAVITVSADVATIRDRGETKYLVAIRGVRDGFPDAWWGVKSQNGKVEDKNEFVGLTFQSFTTKNGGRQTKNLAMTLRPKE